MPSTRHQLLSVLAELSVACPEMRFGQLVANLTTLAKGLSTEGLWDADRSGADSEGACQLSGREGADVRSKRPAMPAASRRERTKGNDRPADDATPAPDAPERTSTTRPAPRPRRWLRCFVVLLLIGGAAAAGAWYYDKSRQPKDESHLVLQGNIDVRQVNLAFKIEGRIEGLAVDEGDSVDARQVIATLDKRYVEDELRLLRAQRDNAQASFDRLEHGSRPEEIAEANALVVERQATLERSQHDFKRAAELVEKGAVSRADYDLAQAARDEAEARLKSAQQALRLAELGPRQEDKDAARAQLAAQHAAIVQAERRLADCELIAPSAGIILTRAREQGAIVQPGETIFALTLASPVWVRTYVNETDLGRIRPHMPAKVHNDSTPGKTYHGKIGFISPTAEFTPKTVETRELRTDLVYRLRVVVENPDGGLRQGMPVTVTLEFGDGAEGLGR